MDRILFVDDEPGIRETLPAILRQNKFEVVTAATVAEALSIITSSAFNVLITDLNIGSAGDGFTVVSAMRRTQPDCITLILTGFPGFDTALQAIRSQVDDYLIKPTRPQKLIEAIHNKLIKRTSPPQILTHRLSAILRSNFESITQNAVSKLRSEPALANLQTIAAEDRSSLFPLVLEDIINALDAPGPSTLSSANLRVIATHGNLLRQQGYTAPLIVANVRCLQCAIYEAVHENLLALNLSYLIPDLMKLNDMLMLLTEATIKAYIDGEQHVA